MKSDDEEKKMKIQNRIRRKEQVEILEVEQFFMDVDEFEEWYEKLEERIADTSHRYAYMIIGGFFGIFSVIIRIIGDLLAIQQYPGYHPSTHMISFLSASRAHTYFTLGLILSSIFIIPYYLAVALVFRVEYKEDKKLIQSSLYVSIISAISTSLVGFFLELFTLVPHGLIYDLHGLFATIAFSCAVFSCIVLGHLIQKSTYFPHFFGYTCYSVAAVNFIFLFTWHALLEWLASSLVILLQLVFGVYLIFKKVKSFHVLSEYHEKLDKQLINKILLEAIKE